MFGFQAEGSAPIVRGHIITNPETIASAIRIGNPASWELATAARDATDGYFGAISDKLHPGGAPHPLRRGRHLRRAGVRDRRRRTARAQRGRRDPEGRDRRDHRHRARPEGPAVGRAQRRRNGCDAHRRVQGHRRGGQRPRPVENTGLMAAARRVAAPLRERAGAGHDRQPRARFRHPRARAVALRRHHGDGARGAGRERRRARRRRRGGADGCLQPRRPHHRAHLRRVRTGRCRASTSPRTTRSRTGAASAPPAPRSCPGVMAAKGLLEGIVADGRRHAARHRERARGASGQRRARAVRRADHRLDRRRTGRTTRNCSCTAASRR